MKALFISDLHLEESRADISEAFFSFVQNKIKDIDEFYILGDFFEVWIGDDFQSPFVDSIKNELKAISSRVTKCYFQHGNRDFLVGQQFAQETGFQILDEIHSFTHNEQNIIVMHGDSLCTLDTEYMNARQILRSDLFIQDVMSKSIEERLVLAEQLRAASIDANSGKQMEIMDVTPEEVVSVMEHYKADILIHGHTHRPKVHEVATQHNPQAKRIVMSDWESTIQYIELSDENGAQLVKYTHK
jgi:UDP-2,3-diacylglucosamine hydrolase